MPWSVGPPLTFGQYGSSGAKLREVFKRYGDISDLVSDRGLAVVTFVSAETIQCRRLSLTVLLLPIQYDIRAAQRAHGSAHEVSFEGRSVEVHYALPQQRTEGRSVLLVAVAGVESPDCTLEELVGQAFRGYGELRSVAIVRTK